MKKLRPGKSNKEERMNFVEYWADYVRTHPDEVWSRQQKLVINSQLMSARSQKLSPEQYLRIKKQQQRFKEKLG